MPEMLKTPPRRMVTIDVDRELAERLGFVARLEGISEEELLVRIIEGYPKRAGQRSLTAGVRILMASTAWTAADCRRRGMVDVP